METKSSSRDKKSDCLLQIRETILRKWGGWDESNWRIRSFCQRWRSDIKKPRKRHCCQKRTDCLHPWKWNAKESPNITAILRARKWLRLDSSIRILIWKRKSKFSSKGEWQWIQSDTLKWSEHERTYLMVFLLSSKYLKVFKGQIQYHQSFKAGFTLQKWNEGCCLFIRKIQRT